MSFVSAVFDKLFIKQPRLRRVVTRILEGDRDVTAQLFGGSFRLNTIKEHGYLRASRSARRSSLFRDEVSILLCLAMLLEDGDTFVDVGANIGMFCCTLARRSRIDSGTRVFAFEANPDTFARLQASCEPLGVIAENVAISDKEGALDFVGGAVSHVFTTVDHASRYNIMSERTKVQCRRLDSFELPGASLIIKVDVEGQERAVLNGASQLFAAGRVKAVYIDGFEDQTIPQLLTSYGMTLLNGRTLLPFQNDFSLLALRPTCRLPPTTVPC